jgi:hypothetical protein
VCSRFASQAPCAGPCLSSRRRPPCAGIASCRVAGSPALVRARRRPPAQVRSRTHRRRCLRVASAPTLGCGSHRFPPVSVTSPVASPLRWFRNNPGVAADPLRWGRPRQDSNLRLPTPEAGALSAELQGLLGTGLCRRARSDVVGRRRTLGPYRSQLPTAMRVFLADVD